MWVNLRKFSYSIFFLIIGICFTLQVSFWQSTDLVWMTLIVSFLAIPILDSLAGARKFPSLASFGTFAHWVPRLYFLLHFYLLYTVLSSFEFTSFMELFLNGLALGTITGGIGITIAHELMHRPKKVDRFLSKLIMASVLYGHFCIEHVKGHHVRVATPNDPATAKRGQSLYGFFLQSISGTLLHSFSLQKLFLEEHNIKMFSFKNELFVTLICSFFFISVSWFFFGFYGLLLFVLQAIWAVLLLEATNYIEHYGLLRSKNKSGKYESVSYKHSWNSNHAISNWILFHLPWHSHHHKSMNKAFHELEPIDNAPQMPFGYPAMIVIAFFPFVFIPLMERQLKLYQAREEKVVTV